MSVFVEKYLDALLVPFGIALGWYGLQSGQTTMILLGYFAVVFLVLFAKVTWRSTLILQLNKMGYTVWMTDGGWSASMPGHGISAESLTAVIQSAKECEIRTEERKRVEQSYEGWTPPSGMVND